MRLLILAAIIVPIGWGVHSLSLATNAGASCAKKSAKHTSGKVHRRGVEPIKDVRLAIRDTGRCAKKAKLRLKQQEENLPGLEFRGGARSSLKDAQETADHLKQDVPAAQLR